MTKREPRHLTGSSRGGSLEVGKITGTAHPYQVGGGARFDAGRPCHVHEDVLKNRRIMLG